MDDSSACEGCGREGATQVCPKCKELGLRRSLFCTQECFKANWKTHKVKHTTEAHIASIKTMTDEELRFFDFTGPLRPAKITPKRGVPKNIVRPDYADHPAGVSNIEEKDYRDKIVAHSTDVQQRMRRVCQLAREVLDIASLAVRPGVTTDELDRIVHEATIERGMYPSPLNYYRFPKSVCTSVNEVICHGIPDSRPLEEGDIVNLDVSCYYDGLHADLNETVFSGRPDEASVRLVHCAWNCLQKAIALCKPGTPYRNIGNVITEYAHARNCSVVRTYCGHGVSEKFHCAPNVPHYANNKAVGTMAAGNIFTIEPMINEGTWRDVRWPDQWTAATADGKRSAQFEETLLITKTGVEILTAKPNHGLPRYQEQLNEWCIELPSE